MSSCSVVAGGRWGRGMIGERTGSVEVSECSDENKVDEIEG